MAEAQAKVSNSIAAMLRIVLCIARVNDGCDTGVQSQFDSVVFMYWSNDFGF